MLAQLPQQPVLQAGGGPRWVGHRGEGLVVGDEQVFAEGQAQHIQVLAAIAEGAGEGHKHCEGGQGGAVRSSPAPAPQSLAASDLLEPDFPLPSRPSVSPGSVSVPARPTGPP